MGKINAKIINVAVGILNDYCDIFDNKEYNILNEKEKTLLYKATVLLEKVVVRMQNRGDYSLKQEVDENPK